MPWVDRKEKKHECRLDKSATLPDPKQAYNELNAQLGSTYQCDKAGCDRVWKLADGQMDGLYWEEVK